MNDELERCWKEACGPFSGVVLLSRPLLITDLRQQLILVATALREFGVSDRLLTFLDWHQHDGYVTTAEPASMDTLAEALTSDETFTDWSSDDTFVRRAWYPQGLQFLLRWGLSSDLDDYFAAPRPEGGSAGGCFDLAGEASMVQDVGGRLSGGWSLEPALAYFNRVYAG